MSTTAELLYPREGDWTGIKFQMRLYKLIREQIVTILPTLEGTCRPANVSVEEIILPEESLPIFVSDPIMELRGTLAGTGALLELEKEHQKEIEQDEVRS